MVVVSIMSGGCFNLGSCWQNNPGGGRFSSSWWLFQLGQLLAKPPVWWLN